MKTDFATIERDVSSVLTLEKKAPSVERVPMVSCIAGFHLADEDKAEQVYNATVDARLKLLEQIEADREAAAMLCRDRGVKPLAIVPTAFWYNLCRASGLYRLMPGPDGRVQIDYQNLVNKVPSGKGVFGISGARQVELLARQDWKAFLDLLFPDGCSGDMPWVMRQYWQVPGSAEMQFHELPREGLVCATLVMPTPPDDVIEILRKCRDIPDLKVASVPDAIGFKESPTQIYNRAIAQVEAEQRALTLDPIVYFESGKVACIIAQFGDFPVEQQVVETLKAKQGILRLMPDAELRS
jgi:hypothetical protein